MLSYSLGFKTKGGLEQPSITSLICSIL